MEEVRELFQQAIHRLNALIARLQRQRDEMMRMFEEQLSKLEGVRGKVDWKEVQRFFDEPYCVIPRDKDSVYVVVPRFIPFAVGWLHHQTLSYNVFVVNRYMQWITPLPQKLREQLRTPQMPPLKVFDGCLLTGKEYQEWAWRRYRPFLSRREGEDRIRIKKGYEFKLIAQLIEDGILPFIPQPVQPEDLRKEEPFTLRDYQRRWWKEFLDKGAVGIFAPYGSGKSFFALYALARIRGQKLVVVPTLTLLHQWRERIHRYLPSSVWSEIQVVTYHSYHKVCSAFWTLVVFDECHRLPANTFIRMATLNRKYTIGTSGSPYREDGREAYIFALTGFPLGVDWRKFIEKGIVRKPLFRVFVLPDKRAKLRKLEELLRLPGKTLVFCDYIRDGREISKRFGIPFIYGRTKGRERLEVLKQASVVVVSRVGDEGISLPDVERVIEYGFLYGSRMQESQRFGRLMHSQRERRPEHIVLMTETEFKKYHKRLYAIIERGFHIEVVR